MAAIGRGTQGSSAVPTGRRQRGGAPSRGGCPVTFERDREQATLDLLREIRHGMATPLSGAAIHLEVASRRLNRDGEGGRGVERSRVLAAVETAKTEVARAGTLLELLSEIGRRGAGKPTTFSIVRSVRRGASRSGIEEEKAVVVERAGSGRARPLLYGLPGLLEDAVADLTALAVRTRAAGSTVLWTLENGSSDWTLICCWPLEAPGSPPAQEVWLARWAFESHGGSLALAGGPGTREARFVARLPRVRSRRR